jgi:hypothetical protein
MLDLHATAASMALKSPGSFVWDPESQDVKIVELTSDEIEMLAGRATEMVRLSELLSVLSWNQLQSLPRLQELEFARHGPWIAPLDMAKTKRLPLYTDDVALRSLARLEAIAAFGTTAVLDYLAAVNLLPREQLLECHSVLRRNWAVDLPHAPDEIVRLAESYGFAAGVSGAPFLRQAFWAELQPAIGTYRQVLRAVADNSPEHISDWVAQSSIGFIARNADRSPLEAAGLLALITTMILDFDHMVFPAIVDGVTKGLTHTGQPDPLKEIARQLSKLLLTNLGPQLGAQQFMKLVSLLPADRRLMAVEALLQRD